MEDKKKESFFDHIESINQDGSDLSVETSKALDPLFRKYSQMGYSIREISHIIAGTATLLELEHITNPVRVQQINPKKISPSN